jgi:ParB/RepB/Spo0J family partition protein
MLTPLLVKPAGAGPVCLKAMESAKELDKYIAAGNNFEIIDGHRRWIAAEKAGIEELRCTIVDPANVPGHAAMLHANIMREDMTPAEEGWQFVELATKYAWSMADLVHTFRVSEDYINERCDLVQKDAELAQAVHSRLVNLAQAKQVLRAKDPTLRVYLLDQAKVHGANARSLEVMRQNWNAEQAAGQGSVPLHTPPASVEPDPAAVPVCIWCDKGQDPENFRDVKVHWYHKAELEAVCDQVGVKNVLKGAKT